MKILPFQLTKWRIAGLLVFIGSIIYMGKIFNQQIISGLEMGVVGFVFIFAVMSLMSVIMSPKAKEKNI